MFQSTHPRRVWLWKEGYERCWLRFQSTHPRRVWPHRGHTASSAVCFNPHTHAGCDGSERYKEIEALVSIHTPTQGVTLMLLLSVMWYLSVSIHTPTQGVTQAEVWKVWHRSFNPHTHAGCDWKHLQDHHASRFQSTHPRRVWPSFNPFHDDAGGFNPHTHAGCDFISPVRQYPPSLFQSTHPRRVWPFDKY